MDGQYNPGDIVLGNWKLTGLLGEGSYGRVFEAEREDFGMTYESAIKIITIPHSQSEVKNIRADGMDEASITAYFRSFVEEIIREFVLMSRLKGTANVVSYEDHTVLEHEKQIGWDVIIRMELLTPLLDYSVQHPFTRQDAIKLGIDICRALELCQKFNIVHRDIKPENIFVSGLGDFKLGDFGIARTVEKTTSGLSKKGSYTYMAPEVYLGEGYGSGVDIYSLGIVMYRLLNDNRVPFLPEYPAPITYSDQEAARTKRFSGAKIPEPKNADGRLAEIVLKACAYNPKDRYSSPIQMRQELEAILYSRDEAPVIYPKGDSVPIMPVEYVEKDRVVTEPEKTESLFGETVQIAVAERVEEYEPLAELEKAESILAEPEQAAAVEHEPPSGDEETERILGEPDQNETEVEAESSPPEQRSKEVTTSLPGAEGRAGYKMLKPAVLIISGVCVVALVALLYFMKTHRSFITVSAGRSHTMAIASDNSLWAWGDNSNGQLGDGTNISRDVPVKIMSGVSAVSSGLGRYTMVIKEDNSLWGWGSNEYGQIGDGTITDRNTPVEIMDDVVAVSAGSYHTMAIMTDGSLWAWGHNNNGQLGNGTIEDWMYPTKIMDNVVAVSVGNYHTMAVKADGSLWAWGNNEFGQLGVRTQKSFIDTPIKVMDDVVAVSAGTSHTMAVKADSSLWAWGDNGYGQLGVRTYKYFTIIPIKVMDDVSAVSVGVSHTMAIKIGGGLWAWGHNRYGKLGDDTIEYSTYIPIKIMDDVATVSAGFYHTIAIKTNDSLWAWGRNHSGQLGDGTTIGSDTPIQIIAKDNMN